MMVMEALRMTLTRLETQ